VTDATAGRVGRAGVEMTSDERFAERVTRLVVVSSVALGVIFWLGFDAIGGGWGAAAMLGMGWISMPTILGLSLYRPHLRYLLLVPASLVSLGLLITALDFDGSGVAASGWWLMTIGVWLGAGLGGWFWFRWAPVPRALDDPFSQARWSLIAVHVALISAGAALVMGSLLL
jgi:hypothetical protein